MVKNKKPLTASSFISRQRSSTRRRKVGTKKKEAGLKRRSFILGLFLGALILNLVGPLVFEKKYQGKVYPGVKILGIEFGGKTEEEVRSFFEKKNLPFENLTIVFSSPERVATLSGKLINLGFDSKLSAQQAFLTGRVGSLFSRFLIKYQALRKGVELSPLFRWEKGPLEEALNTLAKEVEILPQNALFKFENGKVVAFRLSKRGRKANIEKTLGDLERKLSLLVKEASVSSELIVPLYIETLEPKVTTAQANSLGIETLLGKGVSYFGGSSKERIHNIALSSSQLDGILIDQGETFSLNAALGDISPATGYQSSYIIKEGKTVLGDGGGVCQVSTTLFRAALNSGLKIPERHPHSYRVSYYEHGGFLPGIDATIFAPNVDLKIKNDTEAYILIQTKLDYGNSSLMFELYGKKDNRKAEVSEVKIWDQNPPPPDKYIEDPTLPKDEIKQIDWKAWGAKTIFSYKVTRNGEVLEEKTFYSNFLPWQAVFLRGTQE